MRYNTGSPTPIMAGARLVSAGIGYNRARDGIGLVSGGVDSGPLAISGFGFLGDDVTDGTAPAPSWLDSLAKAATSVTNVINQQQLNQINIQRVAAGLQPLPQSVIGPTATVGLSPDTQNLLIYGGIGLAALFLINKALR